MTAIVYVLVGTLLAISRIDKIMQHIIWHNKGLLKLTLAFGNHSLKYITQLSHTFSPMNSPTFQDLSLQ